jgi:hypothetical protein
MAEMAFLAEMATNHPKSSISSQIIKFITKRQ